jgi:hypothetical protein
MSRRRLLSTLSFVLIQAQRVEPKPPINSLLIYRNLLKIFWFPHIKLHQIA